MEPVAQTTPLPAIHLFSPTAALPFQQDSPKHPLAYVDVYIDDFIAAAQLPTLERVGRALFHSVDAIFQDPPDSVRRHVISASKIAKGDAAWSHKKRILGWDLDTQSMTLHLPPHRCTRLRELLQGFLLQRRTSRHKWQRLLGELHSMAPALHSKKYLFSILHHVLVDQRGSRLRINNLVRRSLRDWLALATDVLDHPVPLAHLVPMPPTFLGATDASKAGMGGFWLPTTLHPPCSPLVWRAPFSSNIQRALVSVTNPQGSVTNSDLELAALITGASIAARRSGVNPTVLQCAINNTPALAWTTRGSTSSITPPAFLLRHLAQVARQQNFALHAVYTPGLTNTLADFCSRSFHLSDHDFLRTVQQQYPTQPSW